MTQSIPPVEPVVSNNNNWFLKSDYWKRWSRCLVRMDKENPQAIDVSIEPLNYVRLDPTPTIGASYELDRLLEMRIRRHRTYNPEHCFTKELPGGVGLYVMGLVGEYFYNLFMHEDLLNEINPALLEHYSISTYWPWGGGIPFAMICKDRDKYAPVVEHWLKVMEQEPHYLQVQDDDMVARYNQFINKEAQQ